MMSSDIDALITGAHYRGFCVSVAACLRKTGKVAVASTLRGPDGLHRKLTVASSHRQLQPAVTETLEHTQLLIDDDMLQVQQRQNCSHEAPMHRNNASQEIEYRGIYIAAATCSRLGHVFVSATLRGGPDKIARNFALPSAEDDPALACAVSVTELRRVVDDLLEARSEQPSTLPY